MRYGAEKSQSVERNLRALHQFFSVLEIHSFDAAAAKEYGKIRTYLKREGTPIGPLDTLIAAHAFSLDLILITNNVKEFQRIPELKVENWV